MEETEEKNYVKAGKILRETLEFARKTVKPGMKMLLAAESVEAKIFELGGKPAFPVNLSANNIAAHYTPAIDDESVVGEKDVLKIDAGVHIEGCIADSATTLDFSGEWGKMLEANQKALENALSIVKPGLEIRKIGKEIEETIRKAGFMPIQNLSGHTLEKFQVHAGVTIPSIDNNDSRELESGMAFAIEPFACNGKGFVKGTNIVEIYEMESRKALRNNFARQILDFVEKEYDTLPFAERWVVKNIPATQRKMALRELVSSGCLKTHPVLREENGIIVSQFENSMLITEGGEVKILI